MHWWPTVDDVGQFFDQFWPALVATFLGVLGGVPLALWLERGRVAREAKDRNTDRAQRTNEVAAEIATSLTYNRTALNGLITNMDEGAFSMTSPIDVATYEMFRADIAALFPEPRMRGALARIYAELARLATTSDLYREMSITVAMDPSSAQPGFRILAGIRTSLRTQAGAVLVLLDELLVAVTKLAGDVKPPEPQVVPMRVVVNTDDDG